MATGWNYTQIGTFNGTNGWGPQSPATLSADGSTLYGTVKGGGPGNLSGFVYSIGTTANSTATDVLSFSNTEEPYGGVTLVGSTLYGIAQHGGAYNDGYVYSVPVTGGALTTLLTFSGTASQGPGTLPGSQAWGNLTIVGSTLYGVTQFGGSNANSQGGTAGAGTIFSVGINGSNPTEMANFGKNGSGSTVEASLTLIGSNFYGTTNAGGTYNDGTVFSIPVSGGSLTTLGSFNGNNGDGPRGDLALVGSKLYGTTSWGGTSSSGANTGTIYSIPITGGVPTTLVQFNGSSAPYGYNSTGPGPMVLVGSVLYGTTEQGGPNNAGQVFSYDTSSGSVQTVCSFTGSTGPACSLTLSGSTFYGTTNGYPSSGGGVFSLSSTALAPTSWTTNGSGTWSNAANWSSFVPGSNPQDRAVFGTVLSGGTATVTMDTNISLSSLSFCTVGGGSYVITPSSGSTLTLAYPSNGLATISASGGNHTLAVPILLDGNVNVSAIAGSSLTLSGAIGEINAGTALSFSGGGTLVLSDANTYSGGTTLSGGRLNINHAAALGTGPLTISGGTIDNTSGADITSSTNNAQNWNGDFTYAGSANSLNLGTGAVTLGGNRNVTVAANTLTVGGPIGDGGSGYGLTKLGNGTLVLTNTGNTFSGALTVSQRRAGRHETRGHPQRQRHDHARRGRRRPRCNSSAPTTTPAAPSIWRATLRWMPRARRAAAIYTSPARSPPPVRATI